jgi:hypothetical protein
MRRAQLSPETVCVVYWLFDDKCVCPWKHGYVGITIYPRKRITQHRVDGRLPSNFQSLVLFGGSIDECLALEERLRPYPFIGWNRAHGGGHTQAGFKHSEATKAKMRLALKARGPVSAETREKLRIASTGRTNRGRIGQPKTEEERKKIARSQRGKRRSAEVVQQMSLRMLGKRYHAGHQHSEQTKAQISQKKIGRSIHSDEHKQLLAARMKGNSFTKGKPWSAARRLAWLSRKEA